MLACHHRCQTRLGETVVVLGAGPIGCLHIVIAKARGAAVLVCEPNATRRATVAKFAPDAVIDVTQTDVVAEVKRLTDSLGADVVICANAVAATQTQARGNGTARGADRSLWRFAQDGPDGPARTPISFTTASRR